MARSLVIVTLFLWLLLVIFAFSVAPLPGVSLLPFYGLYPGEPSSEQTNFNPTIMHAWAFASGAVFLVLAVSAVKFKNRTAGVAFILLFLSSIAISCVRLFGFLH